MKKPIKTYAKSHPKSAFSSNTRAKTKLQKLEPLQPRLLLQVQRKLVQQQVQAQVLLALLQGPEQSQLELALLA